MKSNSVRIIAGKWRRRILRFPDGTPTHPIRPTPDRVRETLFNWLGQDLSGQVCLDLFAGSGALGFEAASRGASEVVLVEKTAQAVDALKNNCQILQASNSLLNIYHGDAGKYISSCASEKFDGVFIDPPYHQSWASKLEENLPRILKKSAWIYIEAEYPILSWQQWQVFRAAKAGQVHYHLLFAK